MADDGPFLLLEAMIADAKPERSLMMAYCSDLAYFERLILPHLQKEGAAAVTVLLDHREHENCFSQVTALGGPGVRYRLHAVRLPNPHAAFHPKLYCHSRAGSVVLIVTSANLTLYGGRTNAEVVDRLSLSEQGGDVAAFEGYLELLEVLPSLAKSLSPAALMAIEEQAAVIRTALGGSSSKRADEPLFLHNATISLLEQVAQQVPASDVRQITVFSPFFDAESAAVKALAAKYKRARIRIIKRGERSDDFNGRALSSLASRLRVEELTTLGGKERRLHAKVALFEASSASWVASGSANLTSPAWLKSAKDGGNLEAIVLRRLSSRREVRQLLSTVSTNKIDLGRLSFTPIPEEASTTEHVRCDVFEAELQGTTVVLRCDARSWNEKVPLLWVTLEDYYTRQRLEGRCTQQGRETATVVVDVSGSPIVGRDTPVTVQLDVTHSRGRAEMGRVWLSRPDYLKMGAGERALYRAAEALNQLRPTSDQWDLLINGWVEFIADRWQAHWPRVVGSARRAGAGEGAREANDRTIRPDELSIDDSAIAVTAAGGRGAPAGLFTALFARVQRLFVDDEDAVVTTPGGHTAVRDASADEVDEEDAGDAPIRDVAPALEASTVTRAAQALDKLWSGINRSAVLPERVEDVLRILEHTVGSFLLPLYIQVQTNQEARVVPIIESMRQVWAYAASLHGVGEGQPLGWLVRAWGDPAARSLLSGALSSPDRKARLLALLGAAIVAKGDTGPIPWPDQSSVVGGVQLLLTESAAPLGQVVPELTQRAMQQLPVRAPSLLPVQELQVVFTPSREQSLPFVTAARHWWPLAQLSLADVGDKDVSSFAAALGSRQPTLLAKYQAIRRRYHPAAVPTTTSRGSLSCGACFTQLSTAKAEQLRRLSADVVTCESCGRLLLPFDFGSPITLEILQALAPDLTVSRFTGG